MTETIFLKSAIQQFHDYKLLAEKTFAQVNDADFHYQPNETTHSMAINITHLQYAEPVDPFFNPRWGERMETKG